MKINLHLDHDFAKEFKHLRRKYGEKMADLNGLGTKQLDYTTFIDNFIDSDNVANSTIDPNANANTQDVRGLLDEMNKPHQKLLSFNKIFYEIKKKYGLKTAKAWLEAEWTGKLYMHDAPSSSFYSYCYAYELQEIAERGLYFLPKTNRKPPQHLTTFMAALREFIVWASNRSAGAVSLPSFFVYTWYFWNKDVQEGYFTKDPEYYRKQAFQQFIFEVNQIHTRITQSAFTNLMIMDRNYITEIFGDRTFPDGSLVVDHVEDIIAHQKVFMETEADIRKEVFLTFPVYTYSLLFQEGKFVDEEFARWCSKQNLKWYDSNFYVGNNVSNLSACCRMRMDLSKQFQSSIGGSLLEMGSVKVSTINLMRLALESGKDKAKFMELLKETVTLNMQVLDCVRHIIHRNIEKGLLPNYSYGVMKLEKQTTTNGVTAMFEALKHMGLLTTDAAGKVTYSKEGLAFAEEIMDTINQLQAEAPFDYGVSLEVVPAESANVKLCKKDNLLYKRKEEFIYSNQWTSLMAASSLNQRIKLSAALDDRAGGGQILHINLDSQLTEEQAWELLNTIAAQGVIYFAFNPKLSRCAQEHVFHGPHCPECGEGPKDYITRIVGYLVPTSAYSADRKKEFDNREWYQTKVCQEVQK